MKICSIDGCVSPCRSRGWCLKHYTRWLVHGDPLKIAPSGKKQVPRDDRFWSYVDKDSNANGCWVWTGYVAPSGYGYFGLGRRSEGRVFAHRYSYEFLVGPIPGGLQIDHLCRNTRCVNPAHLEPVTPRENVMRSTSPIAKNPDKTHCPQGHPLSGDNLYVRPGYGHRQCRTCRKAADERRQRRRKQVA